jgi:hypothetical protein
VAVTDDAVYSWGQGQFGALGHGSYEDRAVPSRIRALAGKDIEKVACGSFHTLLLRRDGVVYGCGLAKHGQLPGAMHRMSADKVAPLPVKVRSHAVGAGLCQHCVADHCVLHAHRLSGSARLATASAHTSASRIHMPSSQSKCRQPHTPAPGSLTPLHQAAGTS